MIEPDKRKAIYLLHQSGMSVRQISRRLGVSRNTVREVIAQEGQPPNGPRPNRRSIPSCSARSTSSARAGPNGCMKNSGKSTASTCPTPV